MANANILISKTGYGYAIKVEGRANMDCSPALKNFGENITQGAFSKISFDMTACRWMDSTFMGTLAMLGLKAKKAGISIEMLNMDEKNRGLIRDLGIEGLFNFAASSDSSFDSSSTKNLTDSDSSQRATAETILEAHKTLAEVNDANAQKFGKVIEMVKKDIEDSPKEN